MPAKLFKSGHSINLQKSDQNIALRPCREAMMFISAAKSLEKAGKMCRALLEEKRNDKRQYVSGGVNISLSRVEQWDSICTKFLNVYPHEHVFWIPIFTKFSKVSTNFTVDDLIANITASMVLYTQYTSEERTELMEAAQHLSLILTSSVGMKYQRAYRRLPIHMKEIINLAVKRKDWSGTYLST